MVGCSESVSLELSVVVINLPEFDVSVEMGCEESIFGETSRRSAPWPAVYNLRYTITSKLYRIWFQFVILGVAITNPACENSSLSYSSYQSEDHLPCKDVKFWFFFFFVIFFRTGIVMESI